MKSDWELESYLVKLLKLSQEFGMIPAYHTGYGLVIKDFSKENASALLGAQDMREVNDEEI